MDEASEERKRRLPEAGRPKRGTTVLPDGRQVVYDGDLTVLDKDGDVISWASSDLLAGMLGARRNRGGSDWRSRWRWTRETKITA